MTAPMEVLTLLRTCSGFQPISAAFLMACAVNFGRGDVDEYVGIERLHLDDVRVDGRLGHLIGVFGNDHRRSLVAEAILQAFEIILSVVVVLVEDGDLGVRLFLQNIPRVDPCLVLIVGRPTYSPREVLRIIPFGRAGLHEQLRHLLRVHIFLNGGVGRRAKRAEDEENLVALNQSARLLDRFWWTVTVVIGNEVDLAAVDAAFAR